MKTVGISDREGDCVPLVGLADDIRQSIIDSAVDIRPLLAELRTSYEDRLKFSAPFPKRFCYKPDEDETGIDHTIFHETWVEFRARVKKYQFDTRDDIQCAEMRLVGLAETLEKLLREKVYRFVLPDMCDALSREADYFDQTNIGKPVLWYRQVHCDRLGRLYEYLALSVWRLMKNKERRIDKFVVDELVRSHGELWQEETLSLVAPTSTNSDRINSGKAPYGITNVGVLSSFRSTGKSLGDSETIFNGEDFIDTDFQPSGGLPGSQVGMISHRSYSPAHDIADFTTDGIVFDGGGQSVTEQCIDALDDQLYMPVKFLRKLSAHRLVFDADKKVGIQRLVRSRRIIHARLMILEAIENKCIYRKRDDKETRLFDFWGSLNSFDANSGIDAESYFSTSRINERIVRGMHRCGYSFDEVATVLEMHAKVLKFIYRDFNVEVCDREISDTIKKRLRKRSGNAKFVESFQLATSFDERPQLIAL